MRKIIKLIDYIKKKKEDKVKKDREAALKRVLNKANKLNW